MMTGDHRRKRHLHQTSVSSSNRTQTLIQNHIQRYEQEHRSNNDNAAGLQRYYREPSTSNFPLNDDHEMTPQQTPRSSYDSVDERNYFVGWSDELHGDNDDESNRSS